MFDKIAYAQAVLRKLHEKQAGIALPLLGGAALVAGANVVGKGLHKSKEYKAGFQPGFMPGGHE